MIRKKILSLSEHENELSKDELHELNVLREHELQGKKFATLLELLGALLDLHKNAPPMQDSKLFKKIRVLEKKMLKQTKTGKYQDAVQSIELALSICPKKRIDARYAIIRNEKKKFCISVQ